MSQAARSEADQSQPARSQPAQRDDLFGAVPSGDVDALRARLAAAAATRGLVDTAFRTLDTALGSLLIATTPAGLVSVTFDGDAPDATLERLASALGPRVLEDRRALDGAAHAIDALIGGTARHYDGRIDLSLATGFRHDVVVALGRIPYGETRSYGAVAQMVGSPRAVRAVGTACARNPVPIAMPCHRVVRADGSIGQYAGGVEAKRALLAVEAHADAR